jgi:hypothetical protein
MSRPASDSPSPRRSAKTGRDRPGQFLDVEYAISEELTTDKQVVTVKFQAHPGKVAGGVYGCKIPK